VNHATDVELQDRTDPEAEIQDELAAEMERRVRDGLCFECHGRGATEVRFMRVMSFVALTRYREWTSFLCPGCAARRGAKELAISCVLGWWGIPWGLLAFKAAAINAMTLLRSTTFGRLAAIVILGLTTAGFSVAIEAGLASEHERNYAESVGDLVSDSVHRDVETAKRLMDAGNVEQALTHLERANRAAPNSATINFLLGLTNLRLGNLPKARACLEKSVSRDPKNLDARGVLGAACEALGDERAAAQHFGRLIRDGYDNLDVHLRYQRLCQSCGLLGEARKLYRSRLVRTPDSGVAMFLSARLIDDPRQRADGLRNALAKAPELTRARVDLIEALLELRDFDAAQQVSEELEPPSPDEPPRAVMPVAIAQSQGKLDLALERADAAIAAGREDHVVHLQRASILSLLRRYNEARDGITRARALTGADGEAAIFFDYQRLLVHLSEGDVDRALGELAELRRAIPNPAKITQLLLGLVEGRARWYAGNLDAAAKAYASCPLGIGGRLSSREARLARCLVLLLQGKNREANELLTELADFESGVFETEPLAARFLLGRLSENDYLAAVRRAGVYYENDALFHIALAHELAGRRAEARAAYQRSLDATVGDNHPAWVVRAALSRLDEGK